MSLAIFGLKIGAVVVLELVSVEPVVVSAVVVVVSPEVVVSAVVVSVVVAPVVVVVSPDVVVELPTSNPMPDAPDARIPTTKIAASAAAIFT